MTSAAVEPQDGPTPTPSRSIGSRLARGTLWGLLGTLGSRVFSYLGQVLCARLLGPAGVGQLAYLQQTVRLFSPIAGRGLGGAATKYVAELRDIDKPRAGRILVLSLWIGLAASAASGAALFFLADAVARTAFGDPAIAGPLRFASVLLFFYSLYAVASDSLAGFESFSAIAFSTVVEAIAFFVAGAAMIWMFGMFGAVGAYIVSACAAMLYALSVLRRESRRWGLPLGGADCWAERGVVWRFGLPDFLAAMTFQIAAYLANGYLMHQPGGRDALGDVSLTSSWRNLLMYLPAAMFRVSLPLLSQIHSTKETGLFDRTVLLQIYVVWMSVLGAGVCVVCGGPLILWTFGPAYAGKEGLLAIQVLIAPVYSLSVLLSTVLASRTRVWEMWIATFVACVVLVAASRLLIPPFLAVGATAALLISYLVQNVHMLLLLRTEGGMRAFLAPAAWSTLVFGAALGLVKWSAALAVVAAFPLAVFASVGGWLLTPRWLRNEIGPPLRRRVHQAIDAVRARTPWR